MLLVGYHSVFENKTNMIILKAKKNTTSKQNTPSETIELTFFNLYYKAHVDLREFRLD